MEKKNVGGGFNNKTTTLKEDYFDSAVEYAKKSLFYKIKSRLFSKELVNEKNNEFLKEKFNQRWSWFKGCNKVLDAGCGEGPFIKHNPYKIEVWGIDYSKKNIDKLKMEGYNVKISDLSKKIPFNDSSFDGVALYHVLEHFFEPSKVVSEIKRVLKDGGTLVVSVPAYHFKNFYGDYTHKKPYPKVALFRLFSDYGFYDIKIYKGIAYSRINRALFLFPKTRFFMEKALGKLLPNEVTMVAKNRKKSKVSEKE